MTGQSRAAHRPANRKFDAREASGQMVWKGVRCHASGGIAVRSRAEVVSWLTLPRAGAGIEGTERPRPRTPLEGIEHLLDGLALVTDG